MAENNEGQNPQEEILTDESGSQEQDGGKKKGLFGSKKTKEPRQKKEKAPKVKKEKAPKVKKEKAPKVKKVKAPKPAKPAKAPKPPRVKKEKTPRVKKERQQSEAKEAKVKGEGGKSRKGLVVALVILIIIAAAAAIYYFNLFGVKSMVVNFFISQDSQYEEAIGAKQEYIDGLEAVNQRQLEMSQKEKELTQKEAQLKEQEDKLKTQSSTGGTTGGGTTGGGTGTTGGTAAGGTTAGGTGGAMGDKAQIVQVYEDMKVDDAARILNATTDNTWIADILRQMDEKKAAKIIAALDVEKAVVITRLISEANS